MRIDLVSGATPRQPAGSYKEKMNILTPPIAPMMAFGQNSPRPCRMHSWMAFAAPLLVACSSPVFAAYDNKGKNDEPKTVVYIESNKAEDDSILACNRDKNDNTTLPLSPVEIQKKKLKGVENPLQLDLDPQGDFLYVVTQRADDSIPLGQGSTLHALKINETGRLSSDDSIILNLPRGTRPKGVVATQLRGAR